MRKTVTATLVAFLIIALIFPALHVSADDYSGWEVILPLLADGKGDEFVKPVGLASDYFTGTTELVAVQAAISWIASEYFYLADVGEVWTSSDQMYSRLQGDCEDWAILLCALLRFHTQYGGKTVSAKKVWVTINIVTEPGTGVVAAHAWVSYKLDRGGMVHIEPGSPYLYRHAPKGMLDFNDHWVKIKGLYKAIFP